MPPKSDDVAPQPDRLATPVSSEQTRLEAVVATLVRLLREMIVQEQKTAKSAKPETEPARHD